MPGVSLPSGGGAVQGIGETFRPDVFSGTAGYSIPLPLTTGRGFIPNLQLHYNSGNGNGIFGAGWKLSLPAQKCISSIRYSNYMQEVGKEAFTYEVEFDYGEHDLSQLETKAAAPYATTQEWAFRPAPVTAYNSSFPVPANRLYRNILLFHCYEQGINGQPFPVFRTVLNHYTAADYQRAPDQAGTMSCLMNVTITGCPIIARSAAGISQQSALHQSLSFQCCYYRLCLWK